MYNEFEGTTQPATNVVTLDSNGCAEIYVNALCDMTLKTQAGATLRTVTVGDAATSVEVISTSFIGTDYSGSPSNPSEPITLAAILDKWFTSAGTFDWNVALPTGSSTLQAAFAAFSGIFTNVKSSTFGAVGDGVTDDTTAINNAITAAAGGTVFFPAGTYIVSTLTVATASVTLLGVGPGASIITGNSAGTRVINLTDNTASGWKRLQGLKINTSATYTRLLDIEESQNVVIDNCEFDGTSISGALINRVDVDGQTNVFIDKCKFTAGSASSPRCIDNASDDAESYFSIKNCYFTAATAYSGIIIDGPDFNVSGCEFDLLAATGGGYTFIDPGSGETAGKVLGNVTNCVFRTGAAASTVFDLNACVTGSKFHESGNIFYGFDVASHTTASVRLYNFSVSSNADVQITLKSRESRTLRVAGAFGNSESINCLQDYGSVTLSATDVADPLEILTNDPVLPAGSKSHITIVNNCGATKDVVHGTAGQWTNIANGGAATIVLVHVANTAAANSIAYFPDVTVD
jgi:hypothetical protein